jgi:hypothetical protein
MIRIFLVALAALLLWVAPEAQAGQDGWYYSDGYHAPKKKRIQVQRYNRQKRRYYQAPEIIIDVDDDGVRRPICVRDIIDVVSTEHTTPENAMEAARKMWAAKTQWVWGAQYMDLKLARELRDFCGPSNPMDTASGRINEAVSQLAGKEGVNVRCVIRARPCRATLESHDDRPMEYYHSRRD